MGALYLPLAITLLELLGEDAAVEASLERGLHAPWDRAEPPRWPWVAERSAPPRAFPSQPPPREPRVSSSCFSPRSWCLLARCLHFSSGLVINPAQSSAQNFAGDYICWRNVYFSGFQFMGGNFAPEGGDAGPSAAEPWLWGVTGPWVGGAGGHVPHSRVPRGLASLLPSVSLWG